MLGSDPCLWSSVSALERRIFSTMGVPFAVLAPGGSSQQHMRARILQEAARNSLKRSLRQAMLAMTVSLYEQLLASGDARSARLVLLSAGPVGRR